MGNIELTLVSVSLVCVSMMSTPSQAVHLLGERLPNTPTPSQDWSCSAAKNHKAF